MPAPTVWRNIGIVVLGDKVLESEVTDVVSLMFPMLASVFTVKCIQKKQCS